MLPPTPIGQNCPAFWLYTWQPHLREERDSLGRACDAAELQSDRLVVVGRQPNKGTTSISRQTHLRPRVRRGQSHNCLLCKTALPLCYWLSPQDATQCILLCMKQPNQLCTRLLVDTDSLLVHVCSPAHTMSHPADVGRQQAVDRV